MKSAEEKKQRERRTHNSDKLLWIFCVLLLMLSAVSLWNAYRLHQTANELLRAATAVPPTVVWYEEAETQEAVLPETAASAFAPPADTAETGKTYILNTSSKKIHSPTCRYAASMQETNKQVVTDKTLEELLREGYSKCSVCNAE